MPLAPFRTSSGGESLPRPPRFLTALAAVPFLAQPSNTALSPDGKLVIWEVVEAPFEEHSKPSRIFFADSRKPLSMDTLKRRVLGTSLPPSVRPMTRAEESAVDPTFSPDGRWIAFRSARGPGAFTQVWGLSLAGGEGIPLTDSPSNVMDYAWTPDADLVLVLDDPPSIVRGPAVLPGSPPPKSGTKSGAADSAIADSDSAEPRTVWTAGSPIAELALSQDGERAAFRVGDDALHVLDFASGQCRLLVDRPGRESSPAWAFDDSSIYFLAPRDVADTSSSAPRAVFRVAPEGGEVSPVTRRLDLPVRELRSCRESDRLFVTAVDGESIRLIRLRPWEGSHEILLDDDGIVRDLAVRNDGEKIYFVHEAPGAAPEIASWTFPDRTLVHLTALNRKAWAP